MHSWDYLRTSQRRDLRLIQALSSRNWSPISFWHPGGIAWGWRSAVAPFAAHLWGTNHRAEAWAFVADGDLSAHLDATAGELARDVVMWGIEAGAGSATIPDGHDALRGALLAAGFRLSNDAGFSLDMRRTTSEPSSVVLPGGYTVRSVTDGDIEERVRVHAAAWTVPASGTGEWTSGFTARTYATVRSTWPYDEDLDLVAIAPDGTFAACCIAWLDPMTSTAEIEPVGTDPAHRRLGLASAVCAEAIHRLAELRATHVVIHPRGDDAYPVPREVYRQLGFKTVNRTRTYVR